MADVDEAQFEPEQHDARPHERARREPEARLQHAVEPQTNHAELRDQDAQGHRRGEHRNRRQQRMNREGQPHGESRGGKATDQQQISAGSEQRHDTTLRARCPASGQ